MIRKCHVCGLKLTMAQTHYAEVSHAYAKMRGQGGVHALKLPIYTGRFFCELCLLKAEQGEQLELFS